MRVRLNVVRVEFDFNASDNEATPESPILLSVRRRGENKMNGE